MNVVRVEKTSDYSVISNGFLRDKRLSYKAKGLLANILTHSKTYEFSIAGVIATSKEEKTAIYSIMTELIEFGYCTRNSDRSSGKFGKVDYTFYEKSHLEQIEPLSGFPDTVFPEAGFPDTENQPQRNTNYKEVTKVRNNNKRITSPPCFASPNVSVPELDFEDLKPPANLHVKQQSEAGPDEKSLTKIWKVEKFSDFWERFKNKKAKAKVETAWMNLTREEIETILKVVDDHVIIYSAREVQHRPHPTTWISQRRWEDDITEELKKHKPRFIPKPSSLSDDDRNSW